MNWINGKIGIYIGVSIFGNKPVVKNMKINLSYEDHDKS